MTLPDVLEALAVRLPGRVRGPSEERDGWYVNACGQGMNWARLPFTSGPVSRGTSPGRSMTIVVFGLMGGAGGGR